MQMPTPAAGGPLRKWNIVLGSLAVLTLAAGELAAADVAPDQLIETMYGAEIKKVKSTAATEDDRVLAEKWLSDGRLANRNKPFQEALLRRSMLLALEDGSGAPVAEQAVAALIASETVAAVAAWKELTEAAAGILRRRNKGKADPLLEPYYGWLLQQARAALVAGDQANCERTLNGLIREAQVNRFKFTVDEGQQLLARCRFEMPFRTAAKRERGRLTGEAAADPAIRMEVGEAVLAQIGDWAEVEPLLTAGGDSRWKLIYEQRLKRRSATPAVPAAPDVPATPAAPASPAAPVAPAATEEGLKDDGGKPVAAAGPSAGALLSAAEYLTALAQPTKRPSVLGRAELLSEAAALVEQAAAADQTTLGAALKIELAGRQKQAQADAAKANEEMQSAFERVARVNWVVLISKTWSRDWTAMGEGTTWDVLENDVLQGKGDWGAVARSLKAPKLGDFVLEGEFLRREEDAHPFILMREHSWTPCYSLEIGSNHTQLLFQKGGADEERRVARWDHAMPVNVWMKVKVVFEGDRYRVWIDEEPVMDAHDQGELTGGGICLGAAKGTVLYRRLRVRELP